MRIIVATIRGLIALVTVSAQAAIGIRNENWRRLGLALSLSLGDQACGEGWALARLARRLVVGSLRSKWLNSPLCLSYGSIMWALEAARACLIFFGCALGGWALGSGMGYRRGATDAIADKIIRADHRVKELQVSPPAKAGEFSRCGR